MQRLTSNEEARFRVALPTSWWWRCVRTWFATANISCIFIFIFQGQPCLWYAHIWFFVRQLTKIVQTFFFRVSPTYILMLVVCTCLIFCATADQNCTNIFFRVSPAYILILVVCTCLIFCATADQNCMNIFFQGQPRLHFDAGGVRTSDFLCDSWPELYEHFFSGSALPTSSCWRCVHVWFSVRQLTRIVWNFFQG